MKIYLFAIGGSGSRVLRSLTMLLAAGVELPEGTELIPIILDPDQGAGNLTETIGLLKAYKSLRDSVMRENCTERPVTFTSSIAPLPNEDFLIPLENIANTKFKDYLGLHAGMSRESEALVRSLFSPSNLDLDMQVGFKGNPNIGSIVLGQFERSKVFDDFIHDYQSSGGEKRIFIISSIFGGTGASGFPTLLKGLRQRLPDAHIGALSLQPYFAVKNDPESAIDSTTFYAKTRAAMHYYKRNIVENNDIDAFYFLGDKHINTLDNHEGGQDQRNNAHFVELASALSIIDFAHLPALPEDGRPQAKMYEFGIKGNPEIIRFDDLGDETRKLIATPLTAIYLMHRYLEATSLENNKEPWLKGANIDPRFVDNLKEFLSDYLLWMEELGGNKHSFAPINLDQDEKDLLNCVEGYEVKYSTLEKLGGKKNLGLFTHKLNEATKRQGVPQESGILLDLLSNAAYDLCKDKINLP